MPHHSAKQTPTTMKCSSFTPLPSPGSEAVIPHPVCGTGKGRKKESHVLWEPVLCCAHHRDLKGKCCPCAQRQLSHQSCLKVGLAVPANALFLSLSCTKNLQWGQKGPHKQTPAPSHQSCQDKPTHIPQTTKTSLEGLNGEGRIEGASQVKNV